MNPKGILLALVLAVFASGLCSWIVSRRMAAPPVVKVIRYAVPSRALQAGEALNAGNTELATWPGSAPVEGAFSNLADVNGHAVLYPLAKGQPILDRDLSASASGIGLAARIPDGMRAVALRSDQVVGVAGFLLPGSHVDVLVTYRADHPPEPLTATVLENAVVLATGHQIEPDPQGKTASDVTIVTLLLTPEESQRAVLASTQGEIHFVLRNGSDAGSTNEQTTLLSQLAGVPAASPAPARHAAAPPVQTPLKRHQIETVVAGDAPADRGPGQ